MLALAGPEVMLLLCVVDPYHWLAAKAWLLALALGCPGGCCQALPFTDVRVLWVWKQQTLLPGRSTRPAAGAAVVFVVTGLRQSTGLDTLVGLLVAARRFLWTHSIPFEIVAADLRDPNL